MLTLPHGYASVTELERKMSPTEFDQWKVFYQKIPFGPMAIDKGFAQIACIIAETKRDEKKRSEPFQIEEFMNSDVNKKRKPKKDFFDDLWSIAKPKTVNG